MLTVIVVCKALVEVALMFLVGRGLLAILAGARRATNPVYQLFVLLTGPVLRIARWVTPRLVLDRHLPLVAALLLVLAWFACTAAKIYLIRIAPAVAGG